MSRRDDANAYLAQLLRDFDTFVLLVRENVVDTPDTWRGRATLVVDWLEELDELTRRAREQRRAYGDLFDAAILNRLDHDLDHTRIPLVALLRLTIDELSKEAAR